MKKISKIGLIICGIVGILFGLSLIVGRVNALTDEEMVEYSLNDIMFYSKCGDGGSNSECGITVSGSTIEEKIWSGLTSFMSEEQAAGVMGNMAHEGGFSPARHETTFLNSSPNFAITTNTNDSYGIGLIQWSFGRRVKLLDFIKEKASALLDKYIDGGRKEYGGLGGNDFLSKAGDADTNTLVALELCYLKQELESNDGYGGILKTTTVEEASDYFLENVEKPADIPGQKPIRRADAQKYYDQFHGKTITGGTSDSGGSSDPSCNACAQGSLNINGTAVCLAWPLGTDKNEWKWRGSSYGAANAHHDGGNPTEAFREAIDKVYPNRGWSLCPHLGASCDVGVGTTVRFSGVDSKFPRGLGEQISYAKDHPDLWEIIDASDASPQAGDVVNNTQSGHHTYIIVQDENGEFYRAESGLCSSFFHISRKFKGFESGAKILRSKKAKNSTNGVSVTNGVKTSSVTGTVTSGTVQGNGDINASAIELAWPEGTSASTYKKKAWDKFVEIFNSLPGHKNTGGQSWRDGKSCMVFVNTVLQYAGALKDSKTSSVTPELSKSSDWEEVGGEGSPGLKYGDLEPGDVLSYFGPASPGDGSTTYKGYGIRHEAIYAETSSGEGRIVEASFEKEWGHVRAKKTNPNKTIAGGWVPIVRVFRWKKQNSGSECNICDEAELSATATLVTGGFKTVGEAEESVMKEYKGLNNKDALSKYDINVGCDGILIKNCPSFLRYFVNKYTNKRWTGATGNGSEVAGVLAKKYNLPTGKIPKAYAVFSVASGLPMCGRTLCGHTGVILGVDTARGKVIVGEAGCGSSVRWIGAHEYDLKKFSNGSYTYVYLDSILKDGGLVNA